jgi:hypothetical protein
MPAIEQVPCGVIRLIANERLRVDHEPGLPFGTEHIAGVKIG